MTTATRATYSAATVELIERMRSIALRALPGMFLRDQQLYAFRVRRSEAGDAGVQAEGVSRRYTAITLLGLAEEQEHDARRALGGYAPAEIARRLLRDVATVENLGDVALTLWAARAVELEDVTAALDRLRELMTAKESHWTVDWAWSVTALTLCDVRDAAGLRDQAAARLMSSFNEQTSIFPHVVGPDRRLRAHVSCFADLVYPTQALAYYALARGDERAARQARMCADKFCAVMGPAGQWWWHYDVRSGQVVEGYPVYSVHQDAMAPMALLIAQDAGGSDYVRAIEKGVAWMGAAPEIGGRSLIDERVGVIWRKVCRREPNKLTRTLQALATKLNPALRVPGVNSLFPPGRIDYECRPYHLGWLLFAFPAGGLIKRFRGSVTR